MATTSTTTTNFGNLVLVAIRQAYEDELYARYHLTDPNIGGFIPGIWVKGTSAIRFKRYAKYAAATTAMTENTNPTPGAMSIDSEDISGNEYGTALAVGNRAQRLNPDNLIGIGAQRMGENAALTLHKLVANIVYAGSKITYCNGTVDSGVTAGLTGASINSAVAALKVRNVPPFPDGFYRCIITPDQENSLKQDTTTGGWVDAIRYAGAMQLIRGEAGAYGGVRFLNAGDQGYTSSAAGSTYSGGTYAIHKAFIYGPQAYGIGGLDLLAPTYVAPVPSAADIFGLVATVGWHVYPFGAALIEKAGSRYQIIDSAQVTSS
jgi:N4-gp56 family major capsid protein